MSKISSPNDLPNLASPARRALQRACITSLKQLTEVTEEELLQLHGMGPNTLGKLRGALEAKGFSFREPKKNGGEMDKIVRAHLDNIRSEDGQLQNKAYHFLMDVTEKPVDWAYEAWDDLVESLTHKDNHVRAISSQVLANLAKSDPEKRILKDFDALLAVTKDKRFVTARHCMQSIWKVGVAGDEQRKELIDGLERRYQECITEKNCTLIRYDIIQALRNLYDEIKDEKVKEKALALIETEDDLKYRKKYTGLWRK